MSLETIYKGLRSIPQKTPLWKFALFTSVFPALFSVGLVSFLLNFDKISPLQIPMIELALFTVLAIAFLATSMISVLSGIGLAFVLIKIRDRYYVTNGEVIGNSLSTNHTFLHKLSKGLFPHLIGFIKGHNDPKFEELESRQLNSENKIIEVDKKLETKIDRIEVQAMLDERDANYERKSKVKDLVIHKEHNLRIQAERELEEYKKKDSVKIQQIGKNIDAQDINENTKIDDENTKFKSRD